MHLDEDALRILAELGTKYPGAVAEMMAVLKEWDRRNRPWNLAGYRAPETVSYELWPADGNGSGLGVT